MSKDIRSFFIRSPKSSTIVKPSKPKVVAIPSSSDEDDAKPKPSTKNHKVTKKSKKKNVLTDSDDEVTLIKDVNKETLPKVSKESKNHEKQEAAIPKQIFGKKKIIRVKAPEVVRKTEITETAEVPKQAVKQTDVDLHKGEADFHDDAEFAATLTQMDALDKISEHIESASKISNEKDTKKRSFESDDDSSVKKSRHNNTLENGEKTKDKKTVETEKKPGESPTKKSEASNSKSPTKAANSSDKLKFGNMRKNKKSTDIVFEKAEPKQKKKSEEVDQYAEHIEKKKQRAVLYGKYLQRGGARNPGSKIIPTGADNCLAGLSFVLSGVFESLERDEAENLIKQYGGHVVAALSSKTDYMVVGDEAGPSKLAKAVKFGTKQISEDKLLDLIRTRPAGKSSEIIHSRNTSMNKKRARSVEKEEVSTPKKVCTVMPIATEPSTTLASEAPSDVSSMGRSTSNLSTMESEPNAVAPVQALVEKYRPKIMKQIIGQYGEKSNAKKLHLWLSNWHKNQNGKVKPAKPSSWARNDDGAFFKAALLSGPPGVGKTTTVQVVCAELELDLLEFNASDTRSKRLLKEEVSGILSNTTIKESLNQRSNGRISSKHVLVMDEVDGMAGNEDRGGLQELIALIKSTDIPIICICNDRNHPKMRTLSNYTFDLRFPKPKLEQIRGAMKSLCCREKIDISTEDLDHLILSTNQDIRQVINHLSMLTAGSAVESTTPKGKQSVKDLKLGPWDVVRKVFSAEEHETMSIHDKSALFFHDYNIAGLFVQENYLSVTPNAPSDETLKRIAETADSLSMGDLTEAAIRGNNAWSLLPAQAFFSSVIPGSLMSGQLTAQIAFPSWLGRNSKRLKFDRLLQEITVHSRLTTGASKEAMNLDYLPHLRNAILRPLALKQSEGINEAMDVMNQYHFLREDVESMVELSLWPGSRDPMQVINSKVKAAFTRAYNKSAAPLPYVVSSIAPKKKKTEASQDEGFMEGEEADDASESDNENVGADRMIKAKTTASNQTATSSKTNAKPSKRGRGRGKAK